jgi:acetyltransferase-like isoleucine patch superfamily enzyme
VGVGVAVKQGVRIGQHAVVGAGAVVIRPVADAEVVAGNPARPLQRVRP